MRTSCLWAGVLVCLSTSTLALAEDTPTVELFLGYSYLQSNPNRYSGFSSNGWDGSLVGKIDKWFGLEAHFSGDYGTSAQDLAVISPSLNVPLNYAPRFTFLFGPHFSYRKAPRITPFAHALFGGVQGRGTVFQSDIPVYPAVVPPIAVACGIGVPCSATKSQTAFAMAFGGGIDLKATRSISLRLIQADYLRSNFTDNPQNNIRIATGVVLTFGGR